MKDCPFCGKHNLWTYSSTHAPEGLRFVKCAQNPEEDDGCVGGVSVDTWNKRPIEDALTVTIAQKDAEIERLKSTLQETVDKIKEKINKEIKFERDNIYYSDVDHKQGVIRGLQQSIKIIEEFEGTK